MPNLKIGDVVYHNGTKRKVTYLRNVFGGQFCHLSGFPYIVPSTPALKPVVRVTEIVRAQLIVEMVRLKLKGLRAGVPWSCVWTHNFRAHITRKEYDNACWLLLPPIFEGSRRTMINGYRCHRRLEG